MNAKESPAQVSYSYMKNKSLILGGLAAAVLSTSAWGMTINEPVTPAYVREHPKEWSVEVTKGQDGLIHFAIKHDLEGPKYQVAHLVVYHQGKLIASSDTPAFGKKRGNTFYFSLSAEDLAESKFDLSDGDVAGSGEEAMPVPGLTIIHQFRPSDFVPEQMLKPGLGK